MKIDHIVIPSRNPEQMKDFYIKYLGAAIDELRASQDNLKAAASDTSLIPGSQVLYILSFQGGFKMKLLTAKQDTDSRTALLPTFFQNPICLAFRLGSRKRVNAVTSQLILEGHEVICEPHASGLSHYSSCVADPEGNIVELIA